MQFSLIGIFTAVVGLLLLRSSVTVMLCFVLFCSLMGGAAAFFLPALGNSSVQPTYFALGFLALRLGVAGLSTRVNVLWSFKTNAFLALFVLYSVVGAFVLPSMFQGQLEVAPMRINAYKMGILDGEPLHPTPQNTTQAVYALGTLLAALCASMAAKHDGAEKPIVKAIIAISWIHMGFGVLDLALNTAGAASALDLFRNGSYEQTNQTLGQFHRISGIFPEPSAYAAYAFGLLAINAELWLRNIRSIQTGVTAAAMTLMVLASTSSGGIIALGLYAPILAIRLMFARPTAIAGQKIVWLAAVTAAAIFGMLIVMIWRQDFAVAVGNTLQDLIINKPNNESGVQRAYWARQGVTAFLASHGLGIGPGSFRSSSVVTAILGATGVFGSACFLLYLWRLWNPLNAKAHDLAGSPREQFGAAAGWSALIGLIPAALSSPAADPGFLFALLSGLALAWRGAGAAPAPASARASDTIRRTPSSPRMLKPAGVAPAVGATPPQAALRTRERRYPNRSAKNRSGP